MNGTKNCKQIALNLILLQLVAVISVPVVAVLHDFSEFKLQQRVRFLLHSCFYCNRSKLNRFHFISNTK
jgi:hypothetical protein